MVLVQKRPFFQLFFQAILTMKMSLTIFQNENTPFQAIKTRISKSPKIDIFPRRSTHGFGPIMAIFPFFFFSVQGRKMSFTEFQNDKLPFKAIKARSSKVRKIDTFPKGLTYGFCPKMVIFQTFFFRQYRPGKCLLRYSRTKKPPFQGIKTRTSKSAKIAIFPKGLTHGFGPKVVIFPTFFFQAIQARKMSFTIFQNEKTPF